MSEEKSNIQFLKTEFVYNKFPCEIRKGFAMYVDGDLIGVLPSYDEAEKCIKEYIDTGDWKPKNE